MSGHAEPPFEPLLDVMERLGELIDRGFQPDIRAHKDETAEQRLDRLERALIRQRILVAYLLSFLIGELRRDPLRGPVRYGRMIEKLAAQTDAEWAERTAELDAQLAADRDRVPVTAAPSVPTPAELEQAQTAKQRRREVRERSERRQRLLGH